jgi:histidyl-tRNA synthetase
VIEPRTLKGFRDTLPGPMMAREHLIDTAKAVFRSFGYGPIDTPALEYTEILLGKGGTETDKQMFRFEDQGGRDVAMRFDLTIPLARFVAQHAHELPLPFKRYHVGPVWRGENTQRGRYREFVQCDFDTVGTSSVNADVETALVIHELFRALGIKDFVIRINNRKVLNGLLDRLELADSTTEVLRAIDKLSKVGPDKVSTELAEAGMSEDQTIELFKLLDIEGSDPFEQIAEAEALVGEAGAAGIAELTVMFEGLAAGGVSFAHANLDLSIARGLDYYTGSVFETFLTELPEIGSVCSGGRYDDLASTYTKQKLPGVGASLGVDRLLAALEELGLGDSSEVPAPVFLPLFEQARTADYLALAADLRRAGLGVEVYPEARKLGAQLKYADRRGHRVAVIIGSTEFDAGTAQIKDLATGTSREVAMADLASILQELVGRS